MGDAALCLRLEAGASKLHLPCVLANGNGFEFSVEIESSDGFQGNQSYILLLEIGN